MDMRILYLRPVSKQGLLVEIMARYPPEAEQDSYPPQADGVLGCIEVMAR